MSNSKKILAFLSLPRLLNLGKQRDQIDKVIRGLQCSVSGSKY